MPGLPALIAIAAASVLAAHPGVGIVRSARGEVFYTDLSQVWRIGPDGARSVAVPSVHTHELCLDAEGNLYGEHLWYEGERTDRWGHRVWRRGSDGRVETVIPAREGFRSDYSFVRDAAGNHYWAQPGAAITLMRRAPGGAAQLHSAGPFQDVRWMTCSDDGVLHLIDRRDLKRVAADGTVTTLVAGLQDRRPGHLWLYDRHALMGLWTDAAGNVFVADHASAEVKRVDRTGRVTLAARSPIGWRPTGGLAAPDGALWVLEGSAANTVRVRRIAPDGQERRWP